MARSSEALKCWVSTVLTRPVATPLTSRPTISISTRGDHPITPLAFYGPHQVLEGAAAEGVVILSFPDMDAARAWYDSPAYAEARAHRYRAADYRVLMVEGV